MSENQKAKISKAHIGVCPTDETIEKLRASHLGIPNPNKRAVVCIELNKVFISITEAAATTSISRTTIIACLKGRRKTAGKYH